MNSGLCKSRVNHNYASQTSCSFIERRDLQLTLSDFNCFWERIPANPPLRAPRTVDENLGRILRIPSRRGRVAIAQSKASCDTAAFASSSLWGKFGGLHACADTFLYIVPLPNIFLTRLFSKLRLQRKDFQEIVRLTGAQEVPSSNLGAPTKTACVVS
jgi:hypothetical protein